MKKYEKYKDSGIEWIGEIPDAWKIEKIKHRCYVKARVGWKGLKSDEFLSEGHAYLVTGSDFKNDTVIWRECYHIAKERYEDDPFIQLVEDDLLITKDGTIGKLAIVKKLDKPACLNSGIFVVRSTHTNFTTEFLFWVLKSNSFIQFNNYTSYGSTIQHLYQNVFVEFGFPFPDKIEQTTIANYLDRKTAQIDELIANKKRLLELYEEEKTAIINQAVTKGINPDVKMKDSGIEWLGEIPEHWEVKRFRFIFSLTKGLSITKSNLKIEGIPCVNYGEIHSKYGFEVIPEEDKLLCVDNEYLETSEKSLIKRGDFVFADTSEDIEGSGNFTHLHSDTKIFAGYHTIIARLKVDANYRYVAFYIESLSYRNQIRKEVKGVKVFSITNAILKDTFILTPPIKEQNNIVEYIEKEINRINTKAEKTVKLIDLLTEYRTALISEVVTGKIKVV